MWQKVALCGVAIGVGIAAYKAHTLSKAVPNISAVPTNASTSSSVWLTPFNTLIGVQGLTPVTTFPDTLGTSANVTMPV